MSILKSIQPSLMVIFCLTTAVALGQEVSPEQPEGQISKGKNLIGSYFSFSTTTTTNNRVNRVDTENSSIRLGGNITMGRMLSDHWGLLVNVGYSKTSSNTPIVLNGFIFDFEDDRNDFLVAAGTRYYKMIYDNTYFFLQGSLFATTGQLQSDELDKNNNIIKYTFKTHGLGGGISPGFSYFMTEKLSTEIAIGLVGYSVFNGSDDYGNAIETKTFQSLFYLNSVSLGFVFYL